MNDSSKIDDNRHFNNIEAIVEEEKDEEKGNRLISKNSTPSRKSDKLIL